MDDFLRWIELDNDHSDESIDADSLEILHNANPIWRAAKGIYNVIAQRFRTFEPTLCASPEDAVALLRSTDWLPYFQLLAEDEQRRIATSLFGDIGLYIGERRFDPWKIYLNTAITVGPDPVRFLARMHATCEIHGYVEGPNRAWLADIIDDGLRKFIIREALQGRNNGWHEVARLLRARDDGPVVMSYSVTDSFPNATSANWPSEEWQAPPKPADYSDYSDEDWRNEAASDAWYDLPESERWDRAVAGLRQFNQQGRIEMRPEDFAEQGFGDGYDAFIFLHEAGID